MYFNKIEKMHSAPNASTGSTWQTLTTKNKESKKKG